MTNRSRMVRALLAVFLICSAAGIGYVYYVQDRSEIFMTAPVEHGHIATVVKATGTVNAKIAVDVSSQLSGRIAEVLVDFNDPLKAGQPIARLDPESYAARVSEAKAALQVAVSTAALNRAAVERAQANVTNAQASRNMSEAQLAAVRIKHEETGRELQRKTALARTGTVSDSEFSRARTQSESEAADLRANAEQQTMKEAAIAVAEAELHMAEANIANADAVVQQKQAALDQAEVDLQRTVLRAPIDGIILKRDVNPGQTVAVSFEAKTLFKIANDMREMEVDGRVDEADIGRVKVGQPVIFSVDAYPDREFSGSVTQIRRSPEVVQNVVTYTAVVSAENPDLLLLPGMTATMRIEISDSGPTLKVPTQALHFQPGSHPSPTRQPGSAGGHGTVWVLSPAGKPHAVSITTGVSDAGGTQLVAGPLVEGQQVIVGRGTATGGSAFGLRLGF